MSESDNVDPRCPHCGAAERREVEKTGAMKNALWDCGTVRSSSGKNYQSDRCVVRERDRLEAKVAELERERDAALREADRLRHGEPIEGDFVCPHELSADALRAENARLREIVRVHTHRESGCICERCVESEYDVSRVVDELRAENDALRSRLGADDDAAKVVTPLTLGIERTMRELMDEREDGA